MKLTVLAALSLALFMGGCTVTTTTTHQLASSAPVIPAGGCVLVGGPASVPSGTDFDYTVTDDPPGYDLMDVTIVSDFDPIDCDFSSYGFPSFNVFAASSSYSDTRFSVPSDSYDIWVQCNNLSAPCSFTLDWTATY